MKRIGIVLLGVILTICNVLTVTSVEASDIDTLILTMDDLPDGYGLKEDSNAASLQPMMFFINPGFYGLFPEPCNKYIQTLTFTNKPKGSMFLVEYDESIDAISYPISFLQGLLWGDLSAPTPLHPEELYVVNNTIVILSFEFQSAESLLIREVVKKKVGLDIYYNRQVEDFEERIIRISGVGNLGFPINHSWEVLTEFDSDERTLKIASKRGKNIFLMLVTPIEVPVNIRYNPSLYYQLLEDAGNRMLDTAVEDRLIIKKIAGGNVIGYYFTLTDSAPKIDEWEFVTQGYLRTGQVTLLFTILTNEAESEDLIEGLDMLHYVRHFSE